MLLQALRRVEAQGARELPHSLLEACGQAFRYGIATGRCDRNSAVDLRGALKPVMTKHMAAILEPKQVQELMLAIRGYDGQLTTRVALYLSALLFQHPGNIRRMEWAEITLDEAMWRIPSDEMKRKKNEAIEVQLAHRKSGPLGSAYDRAEFMAQREAMMQLWADYLDGLCEAHTVE